MGRLAQVQIIVAAISALALFAFKSGLLGWAGSDFTEPLQWFGFILCAAAVATSGRQLRERYERLGSNPRLAGQSPEYMRMRQSVRWWSYFASLIIAALAASRFNVSVVMVLAAVAVASPALMIVVDRASGWRGGAKV